jgi:hypothetical protein
LDSKETGADHLVNNTIKRVGDSWTFEFSDINIRIYVDKVKQARYVGAEMEFSYLKPLFEGKSHIHWSSVNLDQLSGANGRTSLIKHISNIEKEIQYNDWERLLEYVCITTVKQMREGEDFIDLASVNIVEDEGHILSPILPLNQPSLIYGDGGSGKSILALWFANLIYQGVQTDWVTALKKNVLYLDYETNVSEMFNRNSKIGKGMNLDIPSGIRYHRCFQPLYYIAEGIKRKIQEENIGFVIVDSAAIACGAEPSSEKATTEYFSAIRSLGEDITVLTIGHTTKAETEKKKPFGSAFWEHFSRSVWEVKKEESEKGQLNIGLYHRKVNNSNLHTPIGYRLQFLANEINVNDFNITESQNNEGTLSRIQRIYNYLKSANDYKTIFDICDSLGLSFEDEPSIKSSMSRDKNIYHHQDGQWGIKGKNYNANIKQFIEFGNEG